MCAGTAGQASEQPGGWSPRSVGATQPIIPGLIPGPRHAIYSRQAGGPATVLVHSISARRCRLDTYERFAPDRAEAAPPAPTPAPEAKDATREAGARPVLEPIPQRPVRLGSAARRPADRDTGRGPHCPGRVARGG